MNNQEKLIYGYVCQDDKCGFRNEIRIYRNLDTNRLIRQITNEDLNSVTGKRRQCDEITPEQLFEITEQKRNTGRIVIPLSEEDRAFYTDMIQEKEDLER